ncbi:MAG: helix-turn-helix domain-containing protein [Actinomycetota bacterium]
MHTSGPLLREARSRAGLSQSDLARRAGVPQSVVSEYESGRRQPALPTLSRLIAATGHELTLGLERTDPTVRGLPDSPLGRRLRRHRKALLNAVETSGGGNLRVFGSVARGEDGPDSDVDLLVDLPADVSLFAVLALEGTLERILKVKVDLATSGGLKARARADVHADAVAL